MTREVRALVVLGDAYLDAGAIDTYIRERVEADAVVVIVPRGWPQDAVLVRVRDEFIRDITVVLDPPDVV